jgi:uncharacterized membrane protein YgdD (TMEM256/DUF423 family)
MGISPRQAVRLAAFGGLTAVMCGAFGAHGLKDYLAQRTGAAQWWEKAVFYHLTHAIFLLVLALLRPFPAAAFGLGVAGVIGFSGSLYLLALTGAHWLVFVTPLGGLCLLGSWLMLLLGTRNLRLGEISGSA